MWALFFSKSIGQDLENCTSFDVFHIPESGLSRERKFRRWWCFSMHRAISSIGGLNPRLASHKFLSLDQVIAFSGFDWEEKRSSSFLSEIPGKTRSCLASPSGTQSSNFVISAGCLLGIVRGSLTVIGKIAQDEMSSPLWGKMELIDWESSSDFTSEHFFHAQGFSEKLQHNQLHHINLLFLVMFKIMYIYIYPLHSPTNRMQSLLKKLKCLCSSYFQFCKLTLEWETFNQCTTFPCLQVKEQRKSESYRLTTFDIYCRKISDLISSRHNKLWQETKSL